MKKKPQGTEVAVGMTDGFRYVGIKPPLTDEEAKIIGVSINKFNQIVDTGPATTLLTVSGEEFRGDPQQRTEHAFRVAGNIAQTLRNLRSTPVYQWSEPVGLQGFHSTPFNPNTDKI